MWGTLRVLLLSIVLSVAWSASDPTDFTGTISIIDPLTTTSATCTPGITAAKCTKCKQVCSVIFQCMGTATLTPLSGTSDIANTDFFGFGIMTGKSADPKCKNFFATTTLPVKQAANVESQTTNPGSLVIDSVLARFLIANDQTTFIDEPFFSDNRVEGNVVAQCDGLTMYFSPGGLCSCTADYAVTEGKVMGVDSAQPGYDTAQGNVPVNLGQITGLRVKQNPSLDDFKACNATFMGNHTEFNADTPQGFDVQCFRKFIVAQSQVTRYNQTTCGTQLHFYNMGNYQNVTNCRDGLGVISDTDSGPAISGTPAGVFSHRDPAIVEPQAPDGTLDDPQWFFSLTPAKLPLDANTQLDMQLTLLTGSQDSRTQLTCIAEYKVDEYKNDTSGEVFNQPILGFTPQAMKNPDSATSLVFAAVLLLPTLLLLF